MERNNKQSSALGLARRARIEAHSLSVFRCRRQKRKRRLRIDRGGPGALKKLIFASTLAAGLMLAALLIPASATASAGSVTKRSLTGSSSNPKHIVHLHHRPSKGRLRAGAHPRTRTHGWTSPTWFADPTQGDEIAGEDPWIRQAAVSALGNLNGSVVVVDPNTGRVLSIVNQKLAMTGAFTPCSTIKPVVAAGALQEGIITPESTLRAEGRFAYTYGTTRVNLAQAIDRKSVV